MRRAAPEAVPVPLVLPADQGEALLMEGAGSLGQGEVSSQVWGCPLIANLP